MQTFLPYPSFEKSAQCLDRLRLGKQRVECHQILRTLRGESGGWKNHPAVRMWRGYESALDLYMAVMIQEWIDRGYSNTLPQIYPDFAPTLPPWFGSEEFHRSHQSNLLRKAPDWYGQFNWNVPWDLPYVWPVP
jgi:hypothetical protein